jgi:hypothetical protein
MPRCAAALDTLQAGEFLKAAVDDGKRGQIIRRRRNDECRETLQLRLDNSRALRFDERSRCLVGLLHAVEFGIASRGLYAIPRLNAQVMKNWNKFHAPRPNMGT